MEKFDPIETIARTRGKVDMDEVHTGEVLFILWGTLTAVFYSLEFILWQWLHQEWNLWLWIAIPVLGLPLMAAILRRNHRREHKRTRASKLVLDYWIFAAFAIGIGGFLFGFSGIYEMVENPMICVLVGIGAFITGEVLRFRPMAVCGLLGAAMGIGAFLLRGELWEWQMPLVAAVGLVSLVIPGLLFRKSRHGV